MTNLEGLRKLAASEGLSEQEMFEQAMCDSVAPGICLGCGYTATVEPDQTRGYCESCGKQSVQSCLILAGLI
jgi:hypothetical protein